MKKIELIFILLIVFGCKENVKKEEYFDSGKLFKIYYEKNGKPDGEYIEYYESGILKVKGQFVRGKANGIFIEYSTNGEMKLKGKYINGDAVGWFVHYNNERTKRRIQYVNIDNQSYINQFIVYDDLGKIKKDSSSYFTVNKTSKKDEYIIVLEAPMFSNDYFEIVIGGFIDSFKVKNETKVDTIKVDGQLKSNINLSGNKCAIICDLLEANGKRKLRLMYFDPSINEYGFFENKN